MEEEDFIERVFYRLSMALLPKNPIPNKILSKKQHGFYIVLDSYCTRIINYPRLYMNMPKDKFCVQECDFSCLLHDSLSHRQLSDHVQKYIVKRIIDFANCNATEKKEVIGICVRIGVEVVLGKVPESNGVYNVESDDKAVVELFDESCRLVPDLKLNTNDMGFEGECVICMDKLLLGKEVTRMPCSHVYHLGCIGMWLQSNGSCPLCRCKLKL